MLSRRAGAGTHVGDLDTGAGVAAAASGVEVIVHAATDSRSFGRPDLAHTQHVLDVAGSVGHLVYVSIVGVDQVPLPYYRRKLACEQRIVDSAIPHTILRATQFHELIATVLHRVERLPVAPLPTDFRFQSVAAADVATRLAELVDLDPQGRAPDFGGPEVLTLGQMVDQWRSVRGRPRRTLRVPIPGALARSLRAGRNTAPEHLDGTRTWRDYVASTPRDAYTLRTPRK
ncbi:NAD(P)H-binding protein [Nocardia callitridis]|uniref:NAD(P)H-binding protein n=1 Tax=Nocardia callitridis TaxID=648753 RepID=A0ABP9K4R5_9NOCA